jgi:hypothetical protein
MIQAHAIEAVITPAAGTMLFEPLDARARGVHDDLYARVLALSDGATAFAIVTLDLVGLHLETVAEIRAAVLDRSGLPAERLLLNSSHTHNAPITIPWSQTAQAHRDASWESRLVETIATTVARALDGLVPATLSAARGAVQLGYNRRLFASPTGPMAPHKAGPVVPWTDVLRVDCADSVGGADGRPLALLFSHAAHPVAVHRADERFTADYPGYAVRAVRERLGADVVPMFAQGCAADVLVHPLAQGYVEAERAGRLLADAAADAYATAQPLAAGPFHAVSQRILLPLEPLSAPVVDAIEARIREGYATLQDSQAANFDQHLQRDLLCWAEQMRRVAQGRESMPGLPFEVQGLALGPDMLILAMSHEVFASYQLALSQRSPFAHTMVLAYSNGVADYVPTAEAFLAGGYEVSTAPKLYGWPNLSPCCEEHVMRAATGVIDALWQATHGDER